MAVAHQNLHAGFPHRDYTTSRKGYLGDFPLERIDRDVLTIIIQHALASYRVQLGLNSICTRTVRATLMGAKRHFATASLAGLLNRRWVVVTTEVSETLPSG